MPAINVAKLRGLVTHHRRESTYIAIALGVLVGSVAAGAAARGRMAAADIQRDRLRSIEHDVTTFRAAFHQASLEERAFRFPDSLAVAVSREARFSVAQRLAQRAEQVGLTDVRVRFVAADSTDPSATVETAEPPTVPDLSGARIVVADHSLAVDCRGELAALLSLVNQLPTSVALQRMAAERAPTGGAVDYHLTLAVFESSPDTMRLPAAADAVQQVAQLLAYTDAPRDSDLTIVSASDVSLTRDPFASQPMARIVASLPAEESLPEPATKEPAAIYRVTTTLMAGARRAALINDQLIYVGESLPDGSKLTTVERDRVVLTDHSGVPHTVAVAREGES